MYEYLLLWAQSERISITVIRPRIGVGWVNQRSLLATFKCSCSCGKESRPKIVQTSIRFGCLRDWKDTGFKGVGIFYGWYVLNLTGLNRVSKYEYVGCNTIGIANYYGVIYGTLWGVKLIEINVKMGFRELCLCLESRETFQRAANWMREVFVWCLVGKCRLHS